MDFSVSDHDGIMRLDRFLLKSGINHAIICRLVRKKRIKLNNQSITTISDKVKPGDTISIDSKVYVNNDKGDNTIRNIPRSKIKLIQESILYEDSNIVALNKPYGLATQSGGSLRFSLDDIMQKISGSRIRIVHRLDKETGGIIIMAKNHQTAVDISRAFQDRLVEKTYLAVLSAIPKDRSGTIETYNSKVKGLIMNKYEVCSDSANDSNDAKVAVTKYMVLKDDIERNICLVSFEPKTGRTHQLRIHAAHILCPIVGDKKYNGNIGLSKKLQLFSYRIRIPSLNIDIEAKTLPDYFLLSDH